jgi:hypothetical protein
MKLFLNILFISKIKSKFSKHVNKVNYFILMYLKIKQFRASGPKLLSLFVYLIINKLYTIIYHNNLLFLDSLLLIKLFNSS